MSNSAMWALIVGFFLPLAIAVVQRETWSTAVRAVVGFLACLVASTGTVLIQLGSWDWHDWIQSSLLIVVTSVSTYEGFWKKTGTAPAVEKATNPGTTP